MEVNFASMEVNSRSKILITAIAPLIWGSTYYVTRHFLPMDYPLTGSAIRALPAGLLLLLFTRQLPRGIWWLKTLVISSLTISGFFVLVYLAGSRLPSSIAALIMALSPIATILMARLLLNERITTPKLMGGILGIIGVALLLGGFSGTLDVLGLVASACAMLTSALGFVLTRRWQPPVGPAAFTAWQLTAGGLVLFPLALVLEGPLPPQEPVTYAGYAYIIIFASVVAYLCWFSGLAHLQASTVSIIGLLNPLTGLLLGTLLAGESLTLFQGLGCLLILTGIMWGTGTLRLSRTRA